MKTAECSKCKKIKKVDNFYKDKRSSNGLYSSCKECFAKVKIKWKLKNKGVIAIKNRLYRNKTKQKRAKYNKEWNTKNPDKLYKIGERSRIKRKDKIKEWRKSQKGKFLICYYAHKRRQKIKGKFTFEEWNNILINHKNICPFCNKVFTNENPATIDHIIPISKGGLNIIENIQPLHRVCNSRKGQKIINFNKNKNI